MLIEGHRVSRPDRTPYDRPLTIALIAVCAAIVVFVVLFFTGGRAHADYCDDSSCTSTVPPTAPPSTDVTSTSEVTTTAAPTTTSVVPSTTTQPPAPSTSTTTTVAVGPPPTPTTAPDDIVTPPQACVIRTGLESAVTYVWYYLTPPADAEYYSGSQALEPFAPCYVPHPSHLPITGDDHRAGILASLIVGLTGVVLVVVSRRRSAS